MSGYELTANKKECPACNRPAPADAVLCTSCGMNFNSGMRTQAAAPLASDAQRKGAPKTVHRCPCGYELTGMAGKPCPECGRTAEGRKKGGKFGTREERRKEAIGDYWRSTYKVLFIGSIVGVALTFIIGSGVHKADPLWTLMNLGLAEGCLFVACFAVCFMFIGFEEDVRGLVMRLIGIGAVWSGLLMAINLIPPLTTMMMVGVAVLSMMSLAVTISQLTEREYTDSCIIAFGAWVLYYGSNLAIHLLLG